jgi:hypothetical protein
VDRANLSPLAGLSQPIQQDGSIHFRSSLAKIRVASFFVHAATIPAMADFLISAPFLRWLCLAWLATALVLHLLSKRSLADSIVLSTDEREIHDRRFMPARIEWQEIEAICPIDTSRSHVVDIRLRYPKFTLANTRWPVRMGAYCQIGYGVPAITISLLLLDGSLSEVLHGAAQYRADLLHCTSRWAPRVSKRTQASQVTHGPQ